MATGFWGWISSLNEVAGSSVVEDLCCFSSSSYFPLLEASLLVLFHLSQVQTFLHYVMALHVCDLCYVVCLNCRADMKFTAQISNFFTIFFHQICCGDVSSAMQLVAVSARSRGD